MLKLKLQYFGHFMQRVDSLEKTLMLGGIGGRRRRGRQRMRWLDGITDSMDLSLFEWNPGVGDGQGGLACCDSWDHKELDTTERLNWTEWCPPTGEWVNCSISRQRNIIQHTQKKKNERSNHEKPWRKVKCLCCVLSSFSHVWLFVTPWTVVCQVPLSMGFYRQEYWSGLPFPSAGDLLDPGIEPASLMSLALVGNILYP